MKEIGMREIKKIETHILSVIAKIFEENSITFFLHAGSLLGAIRHNGPIPWDNDGDIEVPVDQYIKTYEILKKCLPKYLKVYWYDDRNYPLLFMRVGIRDYDHHTIHVDVYPLIGFSNNKDVNRRMLKEFLVLQWIYKTKNYSFTEIYKRRKKLFPVLFVFKFFSYLVPNKLIEKCSEKRLNRYHLNEASLVVNPFTVYGENAIIRKDYYEPAIYWDYENLKLPIPNNYEEILKQFYGNYMEFPSQEKIDGAMKTTILVPDAIYNEFSSIVM